MQSSLIARALVIARARGIHTSATTFKGIMRAIRRATLEDALRGKARAREPVWKRARVRQSTRYPLARLVAGFNQGRLVARVIDPYEPLRAAISAALGRDVIAHLRAVPNSYRWKAYQSAASAKRIGRIVAIEYGRYLVEHSSYGDDDTPLVPDGSEWIMRDEIMQAIRLPRGWRWAVDEKGPCVCIPGGARYYPDGGEMAYAIKSMDWSYVIERGLSKMREHHEAN